MRWKRNGLWNRPDFVRLWAAQTVSKFGTHLTSTALAITAIVVLKASPGQMGVLRAMGGAALLLVGLLAGVWIDRLRRRPILILTDVGRALVLGSIPVAVLLGHLHMAQLYIVAALMGVMTVFFDIADKSYLPTLVCREDLIEANSKLAASDSVTWVAGPALAGTVVQWLTAPGAILLDCASYLFSALSLGRIRAPEPPPAVNAERERFWRETGAGLRFVLSHSLLRALAGNVATANFFGSFIGTVYWLYLVRNAGLSPGIVGVGIGVGGLGSLVAAFIAQQVTQRLGMGRTLLWGWLTFCLIQAIVPLAHGPKSLLILLVLISQFCGDLPGTIYEIAVTSLRQSVIPQRLLGRANASMDFLAQGVEPVGALMAGALGGLIGLRLTWLLGVAGMASSVLWLFFSPIRTLRQSPELEPESTTG